jgi:hypothetical protein
MASENVGIRFAVRNTSWNVFQVRDFASESAFFEL